jgi:hypothetical protein
LYCRAALVFRDLATSSLRSTSRCPLRCTAITSPSRASSRRRNQFFLASDAVTCFIRTMYKSGWRAVKASGGRLCQIPRGIFSREGAKALSFRETEKGFNHGIICTLRVWRAWRESSPDRRKIVSRKGAKAQRFGELSKTFSLRTWRAWRDIIRTRIRVISRKACPEHGRRERKGRKVRT